MNDSGRGAAERPPHRIAVVASRVATRSECRLDPLDESTLGELLAAGIDLHLFVDQASAASERLRRAGVPVWTAPRRASPGDDLSSDAARAREIVRRHLRHPFDVLLLSAEAGLPPPLLEPRLRLPLCVTLGGGPLADLQSTWHDAGLYAADVSALRAHAGTLACADAVAGDIALSAFGLEVEMPALRISAEGPVPAASGGWPTAASDPPGLRVVVATTLSTADLEGIVEREEAERGDLSAMTTLAVIVRAPSRRRPVAADAVARGCPRAFRRQVIVVAQGEDGLACDLLGSADEIVLADPREAAIPLVAAAVRAGAAWRVHGDVPVPWVSAPWIGHQIPCGRQGASPGLLEWLGGERTGAALERLSESASAPPAVLVHAHDADPKFFEVLSLSWPRADAAVWGAPDEVFGQATLARCSPAAVVLDRRLLRAAARVAARSRDVSDLVRWVIQPEGIDRIGLLCLPAPRGVVVASLDAAPGAVPLPRLRPVLPPPRFLTPLPVADRKEEGRPDPAPLVPLAWRRPQSIQAWARSHRWHERVRLALPWRYGFLGRAMEGRW